jgi:hypothetical protein
MVVGRATTQRCHADADRPGPLDGEAAVLVLENSGGTGGTATSSNSCTGLLAGVAIN